MDTNLYNKIYVKVKNYLTSKSSYSPHIVKGVPNKPKYPLVVFYEIDNFVKGNTTRFEETHDSYIYEFDIYATNVISGSAEIAAIAIAREVMGHIDKVMSNGGARRISARPVPNVNKTLYRIIARYIIN